MFTEKHFSLGGLLICLVYLTFALKQPFGSLSDPGPGFFPVLLSFIGILTALFIIFKQTAAPRSISDSPEEATGQSQEQVRNVFLYILTVSLCALVFTHLGILITITLLTFALAKISGVQGWRFPLLLGISSTISLYVVFGIWLKISLPHGLL